MIKLQIRNLTFLALKLLRIRSTKWNDLILNRQPRTFDYNKKLTAVKISTFVNCLVFYCVYTFLECFAVSGIGTITRNGLKDPPKKYEQNDGTKFTVINDRHFGFKVKVCFSTQLHVQYQGVVRRWEYTTSC